MHVRRVMREAEEVTEFVSSLACSFFFLFLFSFSFFAVESLARKMQKHVIVNAS